MGAAGLMLIMPCYNRRLNLLGMKLATLGPAGVEATYMLLDSATRQPLVVMGATHLTAMRTAAASAVATKYMAREEARVLGVFGTGRLARAHLQVLREVRKFERFLVCGRSPDRSAEFSGEMSVELEVAVEATSARELVEAADVICTCTNFKTPLFEGRWLRPGTHLNLNGTFRPHEQEVDVVTVLRSRVVVDTWEGADSEAGDLLVAIREGVITREHIVGDLHGLVGGEVVGRRTSLEITLFKSVGCALEDLVAGVVVMG